VQLWAEDETRLGLKPVIRRVWAPIGKRPTARFKRGYEWTYLYGFVRPESGQVFWMILPTVNTELFSLALGEFAKEVGACTNRRILLVLDKAGWHTGGEVELPEGVHLGVAPLGFTGATTGGEVVAANQRGVGKWALRGDRRDRANVAEPM
jgi:DDE superfamily endonuclease